VKRHAEAIMPLIEAASRLREAPGFSYENPNTALKWRVGKNRRTGQAQKTEWPADKKDALELRTKAVLEKDAV